MIIEIIELFFRLLAPAFEHTSEDAERRRQARCQLKRGREFLWEGRFEEADIRFGIARRLDPTVVSTLRRRERQAFKLELGDSGKYGVNSRAFWRQLK